MRKLLLALLLVSFLAIPVIAQVDSSKVFISFNAFGVIPTDDGAGTYDPWFGAQFKGYYQMGEQFSGGVTYKSWQLKSQNGGDKLYGKYTAGNLTYWVHQYHSPFNIGFMGQFGQAQIENGSEKNGNFGLVYGMTVKQYVYKQIHIVGEVEIGRFGKLEDDALMISLGFGAPISF